MTKYILSIRELKYLTSWYDSDIMNIGYSLGTDPQETLRIQESLIAKEYASSDFDCAFLADAELIKVLELCNRWTKIVHILSTEMDREEAFLRFFICDEGVVLEEKKEESVCIETKDKKAVLETIAQYCKADDYDMDQEESLLIGAKKIEILSQLRKERLVKELLDEGCPEMLSEYMADALKGRGEYSSITVIEKTTEEIRMIRKLTICYLDGVFLILHPEMKKEKQCIRFTLGSRKSLNDELTEIRDLI